jgi:hypothetical protein
VLGPQAFRPHVVDLMEPKVYPERRLYPGGPPDRPYDMTGYELSLQMGVKADRVTEAFPLPAKMVDEVPPASGGVEGEGAVFAMSPRLNMGVKVVNRLLKAGASAAWAPDGTVVVSGIGRDAVDRESRALGVPFRAMAAAPSGARPVRAPRVALYKSWMGNMDEGWTRWLLEQYEFGYKNVSNTDIRTGDLSQFDVLILADEDAGRILNGHLPGTMPDAYVGGVGVDGAARIRAFVENGGTLLAWDSAVDFAISTLGLPLRNAVADTRPTEFFIPGTLIRINTKPEHPMAHGMEPSAIAMFNASQVLTVVPPAAEGKQRAPRNVDVFVEYAREDFLASGWELGGSRYLAGRVAGARVPVGKGQAVLYGFRPGWRGQPHNTFKLLFNPLFVSTMGEVPPTQ